MVREALLLDISDMPEIARLAREIARDGRTRVLREAGIDLAVIAPARTKRRARIVTQADIDAALAAVGSWTDLVDGEQLKRELDAARSDDRPPVEL